MGLFSRKKNIEASNGDSKKVEIPDGMWEKCPNCLEIIYSKTLQKNRMVCPKCDYHFRIGVEERVRLMLDDGSAVEFDTEITSTDPLNFRDSKKYSDRISGAVKKTGRKSAFITMEGKIDGKPVVLGILDFAFLGGSMGSVVGEKIARMVEFAIRKRLPVIIVSGSGGARMQESILSLMQMAKTSAALGRLSKENLPFFSILTDPTTGGVTASFAMLGDINIAEPRALIGFAGPRVIQQTIKQDLPEGFQRSEFLQEHGMIDMIIPRVKIKETLSKLLEYLMVYD
ncbi:MAG TPA: acetyl-CoA carboxylase carboxyltransferase subunit beta [Firmicutes bacterium]|nr:acetyl-CoA carboxylase carboxyltransferase subunit beta [Bacillota bacterium]